MKQQVFLHGKFMDAKKAVVPVTTHALQYGTGCFEGIRAYYSEKDDCLYVFRMKEHYERLIKSAKVLCMTIPYSVDELCELTVRLLQKNYSKEDIYIRPFAYKADTNIVKFYLPELQDGFGIFTLPLGRFVNKPKGIRVNVSSWTRISDTSMPPRAKITGSYVNTSLAKTESVMGGYDEAIFLDKNGHVVEGSAENIFLVSGKRVVTPPVSDDILQGITRSTVTTLLENDFGVHVQEVSMTRTQLYQADEIFLVGTGAEVLPVIEVDGRTVGKGEIGFITNTLKKSYEQVVRGEKNGYEQWVTKINISGKKKKNSI